MELNIWIFLSLIEYSLSNFSEETIREIRPINASSFDEILIDGAFDTFLSQSNADHGAAIVTVETTITAQKHVVVEIIDHHILSIHMNGSIRLENHVYLHIHCTSPLRRLTMEGSGNILTDDDGIRNSADEKFVVDHRGTANLALNLNVSDFEYHLTGAGNSRFSGQVRRQVELNTKGVGDIHALQLTTKQISVFAAGMNLIRIRATDDVRVEVTGTAYVYYQLPLNVNPTKTISTGLGRIFRIH